MMQEEVAAAAATAAAAAAVASGSSSAAAPRLAAEITRLHAAGVGKKKIARAVDGADTKMVHAVLAAHGAAAAAAAAPAAPATVTVAHGETPGAADTNTAGSGMEQQRRRLQQEKKKKGTVPPNPGGTCSNVECGKAGAKLRCQRCFRTA